MNLSQIYEGWKNNLFPASELKDIIAQVSEERLKICDGCEHHSKNHKGVRPDAHCTNCGCTLSAKTKCLSCSCPLNKWVAIATNEQVQEMHDASKE